MSSFTKLPSGNWRAQVRRKGRYVSQSFRRRKDAEEWALKMERRVDRGESVSARRPDDINTIADLVDLHIADMLDMRKRLRRSKAYSLNKLRDDIGHLRFNQLDRERIIEFAKRRRDEGAGPVTIAMDVSYLKTIMLHASAVHGVQLDIDQVNLARVALSRLGMIGKGRERNRRPTQEELDLLIDYFEANDRQKSPMARIVKFAVATAMRQSEICSIEWSDVDERKHTVLVRDRKDPRNKDGNDQRVPLVDLTGYDAWQLLQEQRTNRKSKGRIFPYNSRSVGAAFRRACQELEIEDLHFHDLRHEGTSRLFEAGLQIEQVALVTGHKDWKMLKRYTHLSADMIVNFARMNQRV
ncbi:MAG: site-specific integrase [Hyphomonas sp.]|nr:site-specific integrase [Hyphomonas sp.]MCB9972499.1 site-specific integrase [Hyphomonas sp.]MCC0017654.1 site-specific integrase [Rhodobiaceae bacterium]